MKCPNCGEEMKDGQLICESCGNEIQIVPDFEPEIENSITETLSTLVAPEEEIQQEEDSEPEESEESDMIEEDDEEEERLNKGRRIGVMMTIITVFFVALCSFMLYFHHIHTFEYQIDKAKEYADKGDYEQAIIYLDTAYKTDDTQSQPLFLKAY